MQTHKTTWFVQIEHSCHMESTWPLYHQPAAASFVVVVCCVSEGIKNERREWGRYEKSFGFARQGSSGIYYKQIHKRLFLMGKQKYCQVLHSEDAWLYRSRRNRVCVVVESLPSQPGQSITQDFWMDPIRKEVCEPLWQRRRLFVCWLLCGICIAPWKKLGLKKLLKRGFKCIKILVAYLKHSEKSTEECDLLSTKLLTRV